MVSCRNFSAVKAKLSSQRPSPGVPGSSVRSGGPPWARSSVKSAAIILFRAPGRLQVVKLRHRVGLGPETHVAFGEGAVLVIDEQLVADIGLDLLALGDDPDRVPFPRLGGI